MPKYPEPTRNSALIANPIFIAGVLLLALNDHYLKYSYHNWLTGKISDFAGLLIFPMFLQFLFPRLSRGALLLAGLLFVFWKLPVSEYFIQYYNKFALIRITHTVDYTDLLALSMLPVSAYFIRHMHRYSTSSDRPAWLVSLVLIPASLVFMATSPPIRFYMEPGPDIHIGKYYLMKISEEQALAKLRAQGFTIVPDTSRHIFTGAADYFIIKNAVLNGGKDTIEALQFGFRGRLLLINNVKLKTGSKIGNLKALRRYYRRLIRSGIVEEVK